MDDVVVTLKHQNNEWDLALPTTVPLQQLAAILIDTLNLPELKIAQETSFVSGRLNDELIIRPHETLETVHAADGDFLELFIVRTSQSNPGEFANQKGTYFQSVDTGRAFFCRGRSTLIGRLPNHPISLQGLPHSDAVSRTHANLIRREDGYWLKDERSSNGTIVDGYMLKEGESVRLRHGSSIQFGVDGPVLMFHST
jgi:uncharacterized ubiquitin-like protein YukD